MFRLSRPRQWVKNLLVFVAPAAAGVLFHGGVLWRTVAAFAIFCLAASGTYFLNDAVDVSEDRAHPIKRFRPVASGLVPVPLAFVSGIVLLALSVLFGQLLAGWHLALVMGLHGIVNVSVTYTQCRVTSESSLNVGIIFWVREFV